MKRLLVLFFIFMQVGSMYGQAEIYGTVEDSLRYEPLVGVTIVLYRNRRPVSFTCSGEMGNFRLPVQILLPDDTLQASFLGYKKKRMAIAGTKDGIKIKLAQETFSLKEVQVNAGRITGLQDTITYDLTRFADARDNSLKDVLKKLPGVEVNKEGQISYNGKTISRFTVEGLDLSGGRYNQISDALRGKDVEKAQFIEHDQPIKALQGKVLTNDIALNIGLRKSARNKFLPTLKPYLCIGEPTGMGGEANILQIGKKKQMMYNLIYDRTGADIFAPARLLAASNIEVASADLPQWLAVPTLMAPIDAGRVRFNTSQKYQINRTSKVRNGTEWRISSGYYREVVRQTTTDFSNYYLEGASPVKTDEMEDLLLKTDRLNVELEYKVNTDKVYGNDIFQANMNKSDALSWLQSTVNGMLQQHMKVPSINVSNRLYRMIVGEKSSLSIQSVLDYHHSVSRLFIDDFSQKFNTNLWHTDNNVAWLFRHRFITHRYMAGFAAENLSVVANYPRYAVYFTPSWQYRRENVTVSLQSRMAYERLTWQRYSTFLFRPHLSLNVKKGYHGEWFISAYYNENIDETGNFALSEYRSDYRTTYGNEGFVPQMCQLGSYVAYYYKRPVHELFGNVSVSASRSWCNTLTDLQIRNGFYRYNMYRLNNRFSTFSAKGVISKGFFRLHAKMKLGVSYDYSSGNQSSSRALLRYYSHVVSLQPDMEFSPKWCALSYSGSFTWSRSQIDNADMSALLNCRQSIVLTKTLSNIDISLSAVHYYNELQESNNINTMLADVSVVWRLKKVRLSMEWRNIFNKTHYAITYYNAVSSSTSRYVLRPRELLTSCQITL